MVRIFTLRNQLFIFCKFFHTLPGQHIIHLGKVAAFRFEFDDEGFTFRGVRRKFADVAKVDRSLWGKKGIIVVDGIKLDAWHHVGVKDFVAKLEDRGK